MGMGFDDANGTGKPYQSSGTEIRLDRRNRSARALPSVVVSLSSGTGMVRVLGVDAIGGDCFGRWV